MYYIIGQLLHYRAFFITLSGSYYSIGRLLHYRLVHLLSELLHFPRWFAVETCILVDSYCNSFMVTDARHNVYVDIKVRCLDKAYIQYIETSRLFFNDLGKAKEVLNFQKNFIDSHSILWIVFDWYWIIPLNSRQVKIPTHNSLR